MQHAVEYDLRYVNEPRAEGVSRLAVYHRADDADEGRWSFPGSLSIRLHPGEEPPEEVVLIVSLPPARMEAARPSSHLKAVP